jgi:hypothetical protein
MAPGAEQANNQTKPSRRHASQACCLLLVEPSSGHTSFLQQHHFQGNIQHNSFSLYSFNPI